MEATELSVEEALRVMDSSLSDIKWRIKHSSKRRLQTDVLALCSGMRPVVMVDYGGKMPELGDRLCEFLSHCQKESSVFEFLRVMVITDMIYLVQRREFADFVKSSLSSENRILFVDLENDPPKMLRPAENSLAMTQLLSAQKLLLSFFHGQEPNKNQLLKHELSESSCHSQNTFESTVLVDLSYVLESSNVTIPTLNGWFLGYPTVYLFGKDYIEQAICNLSTKSLHLYQIFVNRVGAHRTGDHQEELMSFTVPYELSLEGSDEVWAQSFLAHMKGRLETCKHIWESLRMEVAFCYPQAIAL